MQRVPRYHMASKLGTRIPSSRTMQESQLKAVMLVHCPGIWWSSFYVNIRPNKVRLLAQEAPSNKQSSKVRGAVDNWRRCCRALSRRHGTRVAFVILAGMTFNLSKEPFAVAIRVFE